MIKAPSFPDKSGSNSEKRLCWPERELNQWPRFHATSDLSFDCATMRPSHYHWKVVWSKFAFSATLIRVWSARCSLQAEEHAVRRKLDICQASLLRGMLRSVCQLRLQASRHLQHGSIFSFPRNRFVKKSGLPFSSLIWVKTCISLFGESFSYPADFVVQRKGFFKGFSATNVLKVQHLPSILDW